MKSKLQFHNRHHSALACAIVTLLAAQSMQAAVRTWSSSAGGDWFAAANWGGTQPVAGDTASFNRPVTGSVTVGSTGAATGVITYDTLASGFALGTVAGNSVTLNNSGNISVLASLAGTGKTFAINAPLVFLPASSTTAGTFTIQNNAVPASDVFNLAGGFSGGTTTNTATVNLAGNNPGTNLVSGPISNGGAAAFNVAKSGASTWKLTGTNTYNGVSSVTAGTLIFAGANTLPAAGSLGLGSGTMSILNDGTGSNGTIALGKNIALVGSGTLNVATNGAANAGNTVSFGTLASPVAPTNTTTTFTADNGYRMTFTGFALPGGTGTKTFLNPTTSSINITGPVTNQMAGFSTTNYDPLTLMGTSAGNVISGVIKDGVGGSAAYGGAAAVGGWTQIIKTDKSTWTLTGANTYTGSTEVQAGGPLVLDFSAAGAPATNIINATVNASGLILGGTLNIRGGTGADNSQRFNGLTLTTSTASVLNFDQNGATTLGATLGNLTRNAQGTLNVALPTNGSVTTTSTTFASNGLLATPTAAFATVGGKTWLGNVGGTLAPFTGYSTGNANYLDSNNIDVANGDSVADVTVNTLRFNSPSTTLTLDGSNVIASAGILVTPTAANAGLTGGTITGKALAGSEVVIIDNASLDVGSEIINNGTFATALTVAGNGTTTLSGYNSYSGATSVDSGKLALTGGISGSPIKISGTGVLTQSADGQINGTASLTHTSTGTSVLSGFNNYFGATNANAGTLVFSGAGALPVGVVNIGAGTVSVLDNGEGSNGIVDTGKSITLAAVGGTLNVGNNGGASTGNTVAFGVLKAPAGSTLTSTTFTAGNGYRMSFPGMTLAGGAGQTTTISPTTTSITIDGDVTNPMSGYAAGNRDTLELGGTSSGNSVTGVISNSATYASLTAGGYTALNKIGAGTWTLSGANTYAGPTYITGGTLKNGSPATFTSKGELSLVAGTFDLNGYPASFTTLTTNSGSIITNNGTTDATLTLTAPANVGAASLLMDGPTNKLAVSVSNNNNNGSPVAFGVLSNFSGGLTLLNGSGIGAGTRLKIWQDPTTVGTAGAIVSGPFGTGPITVGQAPTDKAGIWLSDVNNITLLNDLVINTALGTDFRGIRVVGTGHVFAGTIKANLADATFITTNNLTATIALTGKVTGSFGLFLDSVHVTTAATLPSALTVTLNNAAGTNDYAGTTNISKTANSSFTLALGAAGQIPNGPGKGDVIANGTLALNGFNETINGLTGSGSVDGVSGSPTLTLGDNDATGNTFGGVIKNSAGSLALTKIGTGTQTLTGVNTYTGATTVTAGTLAVNGTAIPDTGKLVLNGGKLDVADASNEIVAALYFGNAAQPDGTYGSTNSSATHKDDSRFSGTGIVTVAGGSPYQTWIGGYPSITGNDQQPDADPDGDGLSNLQEYAFGTDPSLAAGGSISLTGSTVTGRGRPFTSIVSPTDYRAVFGRRQDYLTAGLTYTVEFSVDLSSWVASTAAPTVLASDATIDAVSVPYPATIPTAKGQAKPTFFRVGVSGN